ncbi:MAG: DUF167 domain-containing protein [Desulfobacterales bacterium]|jgi:uncharacterized protein (TIGR00251 family)
MSLFEDHPEGLVLNVRVQPKASRNKIAGRHGEAVKVMLTAPPVDGEANRQCIQFLAKVLKRPKSTLDIVSGFSSRNKRILIRTGPGADAATLRKVVEALT